VDQLFGISQNYIGGSRVDWIHQHVVQHHVNTNDVHDDPDLSGNSLLRLNPIKPLMKFHFFQYLYTFVLIAGFGFSVVLTSFFDILKWKNYTSISKKLLKLRTFEVSMSIIFFFRWLVLPHLLHGPSLSHLLGVMPMFAVCGYYLAFFFVISHNFKDVGVFSKQDTNKSFLYRQVASSSNVGGALLCTINGGLNYQIEHHLFPR
jgi:fatty acid desaturase (delta-4 desaturase)